MRFPLLPVFSKVLYQKFVVAELLPLSQKWDDLNFLQHEISGRLICILKNLLLYDKKIWILLLRISVFLATILHLSRQFMSPNIITMLLNAICFLKRSITN